MTVGYSYISPQELHGLQHGSQGVELIDVRTPVEYESGHAIGAKLLPLDKLKPEILAQQLKLSGVGHQKPLYITCRSGSRAEEAASRLQNAGYHNLVLLEGGTDAWEKAGLPMKSNDKVISLERQVQITIGALLVLKVLFGFTVHELFFAGGALIGAGLIVAGVTRWCGLAQLIARLPWNRREYGPEHSAI